jgi:hypothetical protein
VVDFVRNSEAWKRSGGKDHVFVLTGSVFYWFSNMGGCCF